MKNLLTKTKLLLCFVSDFYRNRRYLSFFGWHFINFISHFINFVCHLINFACHLINFISHLINFMSLFIIFISDSYRNRFLRLLKASETILYTSLTSLNIKNINHYSQQQIFMKSLTLINLKQTTWQEL
jgi:hypothetical protein